MNTEPIDLLSVSALVGRAKSGNDDARNEICRQLQDYLRLLADRNLDRALRPKVNPSDIVQETMMRMIHGFEEFKGTTTKEFYGWLNKILRNEINRSRRDHNRAKRDINREKIALNETGNLPENFAWDRNLTPSSEAINNEKLERFESAMGLLPDDYATVIRLRALEDKSFSQIAESLNRSYDSVTKLWYRAILQLQTILDESKHD